MDISIKGDTVSSRVVFNSLRYNDVRDVILKIGILQQTHCLHAGYRFKSRLSNGMLNPYDIMKIKLLLVVMDISNRANRGSLL